MHFCRNWSKTFSFGKIAVDFKINAVSFTSLLRSGRSRAERCWSFLAFFQCCVWDDQHLLTAALPFWDVPAVPFFLKWFWWLSEYLSQSRTKHICCFGFIQREPGAFLEVCQPCIIKAVSNLLRVDVDCTLSIGLHWKPMVPFLLKVLWFRTYCLLFGLTRSCCSSAGFASCNQAPGGQINTWEAVFIICCWLLFAAWAFTLSYVSSGSWLHKTLMLRAWGRLVASCT